MGWTHYFHRNKLNEDWADELASHIQIATDDNIARGMPPAEAAVAARRRFGNSTFIKERIYQMNTIGFLDTLCRDIRYGLRILGRSKGFTAAVLLTLAIGIGANTAVFTVLDSVLLRPSRTRIRKNWWRWRQTVAPGVAGLGSVADGLLLSPSMYFTYSEQNRAFQSLGVWVEGHRQRHGKL